MRNVVIASLLVLLTASAFAEYREAWVSPSELKNMEAKQKGARIKASPKAPLTPKFASPRSRDPQCRASGQTSSDPIAAFAHDGGGTTVPRKLHATKVPPHTATIVRKKVKEHVGHPHRMKTVTSSMV